MTINNGCTTTSKRKVLVLKCDVALRENDSFLPRDSMCSLDLLYFGMQIFGNAVNTASIHLNTCVIIIMFSVVKSTFSSFRS